ncbi:MAG: toxin-antitoxin system YwqK family antitoxin [Bacteroidia bacterium]
MNTLLKPAFILILCTLLLFACKRNTNESQKLQNTGPSHDTVRNIDSLQHPAVASNPQVKDGISVTRYPNGVVKMQGNYKDGKRTGEWQSFYPDGKLNSDEYFTDGQTEGNVVVYFENGQKMYEGQNHNGKMVGVWRYWNERGQPTSTKDYSKQQDFKKP